MNPRIFKKKSKQARDILARDYNYPADSFGPIDQGEPVDGVGETLGGTIIWAEPDYWGEWDEQWPQEILGEIRYWDSLTPEELEAML